MLTSIAQLYNSPCSIRVNIAAQRNGLGIIVTVVVGGTRNFEKHPINIESYVGDNEEIDGNNVVERDS